MEILTELVLYFLFSFIILQSWFCNVIKESLNLIITVINNINHTFIWCNIAGESIACEKLDKDACAFAVSSAGKRCVLEKHVKRSGQEAYSCGTSEIEAEKLKNLIETDQCIKACGLDRKSLGISSDSLLDTTFTQKLCSPQCYDSCPNIVDLFFNLAAGEGNSITFPFLFLVNFQSKVTQCH